MPLPLRPATWSNGLRVSVRSTFALASYEQAIEQQRSRNGTAEQALVERAVARIRVNDIVIGRRAYKPFADWMFATSVPPRFAVSAKTCG